MPSPSSFRYLKGLTALVVGSTLFLSACGEQATAPVDPNIMEILVQIPELSIVTEMIQAAGLEETIATQSPITIFAPLNVAFENVDLEGYDQEAIGSVLKFHVATASTPSWELANGQVLETLQNESVTIRIENGRGFIEQAEIVAIDGIAMNGVIHVIDGLLIPPSLIPVDNDNGDEVPAN